MSIYQILSIKLNLQSSEVNNAVTAKKFSLLMKSILDRLIAAIALLVFSPVMLVVAIAIYLRMGGPVFFTQPRPGKNGRVFNFYKFRTMTSDCDANGDLLPDEQRLIPLGQFLRKTSLDELPQLLNVLKGDMSFVGPRPLLVRYLDRYTPEQARRHDVMPGITGWAQVNGRNSIGWDAKFKLDVSYVDNWSLWFDLKILFLTVLKVLKRDGITQEGYTTSEEFRGLLDNNQTNSAIE
ncbi:UDP-galactose phosphate transferase [filamentous cyanobacterium Phorm 46]|nr:UDP-galactose phosphate transferase [filamentous cyanobacterium Phorm 46]PSB26082.1 UDP-galactose phosphate transferase [filamentous cyanobacterium Phorm 46]PSB50039.1 UDP-galactose phosphate transferase [filamentous cyanobacterium Phorm 6]